MTLSADIFRQYDIRGIVGRDLTEEAAELVGAAYAAYLLEHGTRGAIAVGRDNRPSGEYLQPALVRGLDYYRHTATTGRAAPRFRRRSCADSRAPGWTWWT